MTVLPPVLTEHFSSVAPHYDAVLCDVWGVVHNGVAAHPDAADALTKFRGQGGTVVLISNAPRPGDWVSVSARSRPPTMRCAPACSTTRPRPRTIIAG